MPGEQNRALCGIGVRLHRWPRGGCLCLPLRVGSKRVAAALLLALTGIEMESEDSP